MSNWSRRLRVHHACLGSLVSGFTSSGSSSTLSTCRIQPSHRSRTSSAIRPSPKSSWRLRSNEAKDWLWVGSDCSRCRPEQSLPTHCCLSSLRAVDARSNAAHEPIPKRLGTCPGLQLSGRVRQVKQSHWRAALHAIVDPGSLPLTLMKTGRQRTCRDGQDATASFTAQSERTSGSPHHGPYTLFHVTT